MVGEGKIAGVDEKDMDIVRPLIRQYLDTDVNAEKVYKMSGDRAYNNWRVGVGDDAYVLRVEKPDKPKDSYFHGPRNMGTEAWAFTFIRTGTDMPTPEVEKFDFPAEGPPSMLLKAWDGKPYGFVRNNLSLDDQESIMEHLGELMAQVNGNQLHYGGYGDLDSLGTLEQDTPFASIRERMIKLIETKLKSDAIQKHFSEGELDAIWKFVGSAEYHDGPIDPYIVMYDQHPGNIYVKDNRVVGIAHVEFPQLSFYGLEFIPLELNTFWTPTGREELREAFFKGYFGGNIVFTPEQDEQQQVFLLNHMLAAVAIYDGLDDDEIRREWSSQFARGVNLMVKSKMFDLDLIESDLGITRFCAVPEDAK